MLYDISVEVWPWHNRSWSEGVDAISSVVEVSMISIERSSFTALTSNLD